MAVAVDRDVLLQFFLTVARFEYALKTGGFAMANGKKDFDPEAHADRRRFAKSLPQDLVSTATGKLAESCNRLLLSSPCELVLVKGKPMWRLFAPSAPGDTPDDLLISIRHLRNGVFHGNHASSAQPYPPDYLEQLLRDAVLVLEACVSKVPSVSEAYANAAL